MAGWAPSGAAAIQVASAAAAEAKRPGAVKYEATATLRRPRAASARRAAGTVGVAAEAYAGTTGTPPSRSLSSCAVRRVPAADSGSREPAAASTTALLRFPSSEGRQPASVSLAVERLDQQRVRAEGARGAGAQGGGAA